MTDAVTLIQSDVAAETGSVKPLETKPLKQIEQNPKRLLLAKRKKENPVLCCEDVITITNLNFTLYFSLLQATKQQKDCADYQMYFIDDNGGELCQHQQLHLSTQEEGKVFFSLNSSASSMDKCYLVIQSSENAENEAEQLLEFPIMISFRVDFDF